MAPTIPQMTWAQDKTHLWFTIKTKAPKDACKIDITDSTLKFSSSHKGAEEAVEFSFEKKIDVEQSKNKHGRVIECLLKKAAEDEGPYWNHMMAADDAKKLKQWCKTDFDRWKDEDDSDDEKALADGNQDFSGFGGGGMPPGMGGMGGMPGMGGMGGMPGMGGMGGMDMASMMAGMGGGADGAPGGMDMEAMMAKIKAAGAGGGMDAMSGMPGMDGMGGGDSDDELPELVDDAAKQENVEKVD